MRTKQTTRCKRTLMPDPNINDEEAEQGGRPPPQLSEPQAPAQAPAQAQAQAQADPNVVSINVRGGDGAEVSFKIKRKTPLKMMMDTYAQAKKVSRCVPIHLRWAPHRGDANAG